MGSVKPEDVHASLAKHMLVDGMDMVFDMKRSQGVNIYDARDGRRFLDFFSFFVTYPVGINHPKMLEPAFKEKLGEVAIQKPSNSDVYTVEMAEFVETYSRVAIPEYAPYLFMVAGGALAVENALKASFDWKVRKNFARGLKEERGQQIIHFEQCFHGRSGYTLSLTNTADPRKTKYFPKFNWPRVHNPKISFPLEGANLEAVIEAEAKAVEQIKQALVDNENDIAALIIEPIQGEGGDNHFRKEFFRELRTLADENEFMFIVDEVQTGLGLTGKMWAHEHMEVLPDMICFGKRTQVCGFLASRRLDEVEDHVFKESSRINSTWGGNLVDMVRAARYMEIIESEQLVENACKVGAHLLSGLQGLQSDFPKLVSNARGRGLMCAFDLPDTETRDKFCKVAYEKGMLILPSGETSVRFRSSLTLTPEECDEGLEMTKRTLEELG
jgi:L-lysine 6-transaminase